MRQQKNRRGNKWCRKKIKRKTKPSVVDPTPSTIEPPEVDPPPVDFTPSYPSTPLSNTLYSLSLPILPIQHLILPYPPYLTHYPPYSPYPIPYPPYPTPHTPSYPTPTFNPHPHPFHVNPPNNRNFHSQPIFSQPSDQPPIIYVNPNIFCQPMVGQGAKIKNLDEI